MLVLATLLTIGIFVAFLLRFLVALHSEARLEKERDARTKQIAGNRIPIAVEVRKAMRGLTVTSINPGLVHSNPTTGMSKTPMRRALAALSGITVQVIESSQTKRGA